MTPATHDGTVRAARALWLLCALVAVSGYGFIVQPGEARVHDANQHARALYDDANRNEAKIRRRTQLSRVRTRVVNDLLRLSAQTNAAATTSNALRLFADEGRRYHVDIRSLAPDAADTAQQDDLASAQWSLGVRGRFRDIVTMLADLPAHDVLLDVRDVEIAATTSRPSHAPMLDATIHTTVLRVRSRRFLGE
jgi:hypothetical protein